MFNITELKQEMEQTFKTQDNDCSSREVNLNGSNSGIDLDDVFLDFSMDIPDPVALLSQPSTGAFIFTEGNMSLIKGMSKSRKTTLVVALSAALLGKETVDMEAHGDDYTVVIVDTEQGENLGAMTGRKVLRMMGWNDHQNNDRFKYANLRGFDKDTRLKIIKEIVETLHPTVIFIDGIVDLCGDFNDLKASANLIQEILMMVANSKTHICCCLHTNKDGRTARGHLGAMYMQKCETTISVNYDNNSISTCSPDCEGCRHLLFNDFSLTINEKMLPELAELPQGNGHRESASERAKKYIDSAFATNGYKPLRHNELVKGIMKAALDDNIKAITDRTAKKYIKSMVESGFIIKNGNGRNMTYVVSGHDHNQNQNQETQSAFDFDNPQPEDDEPAPF